jgi:dTDP-glucose pyrophosphorylase
MIGNNIVFSEMSIISAMKLMDEIKRKLLFIVKPDQKFIGVLSLGDIQRAIINQKSLETPITNILRNDITVSTTKQSFEEIKQFMIENRVEAMPILEENGYLTKVLYWEDIMDDDSLKVKPQFNIPIVIMAGGQGTRLKPLTNVIPKPLIPIGDKTILEEIMDSFKAYGCENFYISVNYKAEMIRYYIEHQSISQYNISYFQEDKPLGTAGSLHLLDQGLNDTFFVSNCDILIDQDYSEILAYHRENKNELTVVAALKSFSIPYGTIETGENGILNSITEKPEITFKINTGLYILEPSLLKEIPKNTFYHITTLIEDLQKQNRRVGVFPISENSWKDIGEWKEYLKLIHE